MDAYITIEDADIYFGERLYTSPWDNAETDDKTKALKMATRIIDRLNFLDDKYDEDQERQFPRNTDTTVPTDIQYACAEIALTLLDGVDPELEFQNLSVKMHKHADVQTTYDRTFAPEHLIAGVPSPTAWRYLKPYLRETGSINIHRVS